MRTSDKVTEDQRKYPLTHHTRVSIPIRANLRRYDMLRRERMRTVQTQLRKQLPREIGQNPQLQNASRS